VTGFPFSRASRADHLIVARQVATRAGCVKVGAGANYPLSASCPLHLCTLPHLDTASKLPAPRPTSCAVYYQSNLAVTIKAEQDAGHEARRLGDEKVIRTIITPPFAFPGPLVFGEEHRARTRSAPEYLWLVDRSTAPSRFAARDPSFRRRSH